MAHYEDEWIELYNPGSSSVSLDGWRLVAADGDPDIALSGVILPQAYYLIERHDESTVQDVPADLVDIFGNGLENGGEALWLLDADGELVDSANGDGDEWSGGESTTRSSMERVNPLLPDSDSQWGSNDGVTRNGLDAAGNPINGTPRAWNSVGALVDLVADMQGPATVASGAVVTYTLSVQNSGVVTAGAVVLTDSLPFMLSFLSSDGPVSPSWPLTNTLVWQLGDLPPSETPLTWTVAAQVTPGWSGLFTNVLTVTTVTAEANWTDNQASVATRAIYTPEVRLAAVHYYALQGDDEAVQLFNAGVGTADLGGWSLTDFEGEVHLPADASLPAGTSWWLARDAAAFAAQFGFAPDFEAANTDPDVPDLSGTWPVLANDGDEVVLLNVLGVVQDVLVYGDGNANQEGWSGPALQPYSAASLAVTGQVLYRKFDVLAGRPLVDSGTAADWAQDRSDPISGRRVRYPGWDLESFLLPLHVTETAQLTVAVGPDHLDRVVAAELEAAQERIQISSYTFENTHLAEIVAARAAAGVSVTVLLEGNPAFGVSDQQRWVCQHIEENGGRCLLMVNDEAADIYDRYTYLHAKYAIVDGQRALVGSENLGWQSMPFDDKTDGTAGHRGVYLVTDAPTVVAHLEQLFALDADQAAHRDIGGSEYLGAPPAGYVPLAATNPVSYTVYVSEPLVLDGVLELELVQSPENSLTEGVGLLGLLGQAGVGDTILVEQMHEPAEWGPSGSNPADDPNVRLMALVAAARRGARVRLLLDSFFLSSQEDNESTCAYVRALAQTEHLEFDCATANPTEQGIHNKMVLAWVGGRGYVHVGSLNGSELSHKGNREVALQIQSDEAYRYLARVFERDWPHRVFFPLAMNQYRGPASYPLVSEVLYNPSGQDDPDQEWVELYNPTGRPISLDGWRLGDAAAPDDYEAMYRFPAGALIGPHQFLVVAINAERFYSEYQRYPDYELWGRVAHVPDLVRVEGWGDGDFTLGNVGDQVLLLDEQARPVDVLVWGEATYPNVVAHPGFETGGHSLERSPIWRDTDDCSVDFWERPFPNPGE